MTDAKWEAMGTAKQETYLQEHDYMICEACHEPHSNIVAGMVSELCRKCERLFERDDASVKMERRFDNDGEPD